MLTDQKQYVRHLQITSDLICFVLVYLIVVPTVIAAGSDCGILSLTMDSLLHNNCIYKSPLFVGGALAAVLASAIIASAAVTLVSFSARKIYTVVLIPMGLCLLTWVLLWRLLSLFSLPHDQIRIIQITTAAILFLFLILNRMNILLLLQKSVSHPFLIRHVALAGMGDTSIETARFITNHPETGLRLAGFLSTRMEECTSPLSGFKVLGSVTGLPSVVQDQILDLVLVADESDLDGQMDFLFRTCATMGIELGCQTALPDTTGRTFPILDALNGDPFYLYRFVYIKPLSAFFKRTFDFCGASFLILMCIPFWIVVPLMIKASSKGPVFFRQERVGKYGRKFILYKFRSMHENAEQMQDALQHLNEMDGPAFKIRNDPRQTPTGRVLRKHSLDELPQLFNVFMGDISLVGPRPAMEDEVLQYRPAERRRLSVSQGITCIWQISGRNEIKFDEWMKLDLMYIDNWSSVSDFKILFKTIPAVLMKRGAY